MTVTLVRKLKMSIPICVAVLILGFGNLPVFAEASESVLHVPLIGISIVPSPLVLPKGPGNVTYHYAVKNFLWEAALTDVQVFDTKCGHVTFIEGDDNDDSQLDFSETWRYTCATKLLETTESIATAIGTANNLLATHKAYATVIVGSNSLAPLVNIINVSKIAYPLDLPAEGGDVIFTYRVNNPGVAPLHDVVVIDDKCSAMSNKLGDINGNDRLDVREVWIYSCATHLTETTTNTVSVTAFAGGLKAVGYSTLTVTVARLVPGLPETGTISDMRNIVWGVLAFFLAGLIIFFSITRKSNFGKNSV
ncbi:MAG: hypothetical protein NUV53_02770 [Patescibacteria group bacterium]|nr:hypothetical protein [Patescibacteria group bacterium]